jgi:hypothetical protein
MRFLRCWVSIDGAGSGIGLRFKTSGKLWADHFKVEAAAGLPKTVVLTISP